MEIESPEAGESKLAPVTKFEQEIVRMRKDFGGLTIIDINDKKGFDKVSAARKEAKSVRNNLENIRKVLVDEAVKWQRQVNEKAKDIKTQIEEIEHPLQKMEDDYLLEKQRQKDAEIKARKDKIQNRAQVITSMDAKFDGVYYTLGEARLSQSQLEDLSDSEFQDKVEVFEVAAAEALTVKLETERLAKIEADRLEAQRKEQEAQAAELKRQQEQLDAEKQRIADEQQAREDAEKTKEIEANRLAELEKAKEDSAKKAIADAEFKRQQELDRIEREKALMPDIQKFNEMSAQVLAVIDSFDFKTKQGKSAKINFDIGVHGLIASLKLA